MDALLACCTIDIDIGIEAVVVGIVFVLGHSGANLHLLLGHTQAVHGLREVGHIDRVGVGVLVAQAVRHHLKVTGVVGVGAVCGGHHAPVVVGLVGTRGIVVVARAGLQRGGAQEVVGVVVAHLPHLGGEVGGGGGGGNGGGSVVIGWSSRQAGGPNDGIIWHSGIVGNGGLGERQVLVGLVAVLFSAVEDDEVVGVAHECPVQTFQTVVPAIDLVVPTSAVLAHGASVVAHER